MLAVTCFAWEGRVAWQQPGGGQQRFRSFLSRGSAFLRRAHFGVRATSAGRSLWGLTQDPHACACLSVFDPVQLVCSLARTGARLSVPCTLRHSSFNTANIPGSYFQRQSLGLTFSTDFDRAAPDQDGEQSPQVFTGQTVCLAHLSPSKPVLGSLKQHCSYDNSSEFEQSKIFILSHPFHFTRINVNSKSKEQTGRRRASRR